MPPLKPYTSDLSYSYALGVFPSFSLMEKRPECASRLLLSERAHGEGVDKLRALCQSYGIREEIATKALSRISAKENCFAAIVFEKFDQPLQNNQPHVVLHHPMDEGNLGTIIRTLLGLGIENLAIIRPAVDPFDPKVVRATMGALFSMHIHQYDSFEDYQNDHPSHALYPFMLTGSVLLGDAVKDHPPLYSLVFGNESSGLPDAFSALGQPVRIPHRNTIDSLNLAVAVSIGAYQFVYGQEV